MIFKTRKRRPAHGIAPWPVLGFLCAALLIHFPQNALGHGDEDHGEGSRETELVPSASARLALESELFQLVAMAKDGTLTLYLDRFSTNEPVAGATIEVTAGTETALAEEMSPGTYRLTGDFLHEGQQGLIVSIVSGSDADLLLGELAIPAQNTDRAAPSALPGADFLPAALVPYLGEIVDRLSGIKTGYLMTGLFALGLLAGLFLRNKAFPVAAVLLLALGLPAGKAEAHGGHDHGTQEPAPTVQGERPQRLADGSVFLPKPTQRLLKIRTAPALPSVRPRSLSLLGKIVADPAHMSVVEAIRDGQIGVPASGLPVIGQNIDADDIIATLTPVLSPETRAGLAEQLGAIEQEMALAEQRLKRFKSVASVQIAGAGGGNPLNPVSRGSIEELEVQIETLKRRHDTLSSIGFGAIDLRASKPGTVSKVNVTAGGVVAAGDTLIEIVDPRKIWVEAAAYPGQDMRKIARARAVLPHGSGEECCVALSFVSRSVSLTAQAQSLFFRLETDAAIPLETPITVIVEAEEDEQNLFVPSEAVVRGASGLAVIWVQEAPEKFRPQIVATQTLDGVETIVKTGIEKGERIVVEGANFLEQVR